MLITSQYAPDINPGMFHQSRLLLPGLDISRVFVCSKRAPDLVKDHGLSGWPGVMAAVLYQAKIDALAGDQLVIDWLASDQCADYCLAIGFNHANILSWLTRREIKSVQCGWGPNGVPSTPFTPAACTNERIKK